MASAGFEGQLHYFGRLSVKVHTAPVANREIKVTIELDQEVVDSALKDAAEVAAQKIKIPGFRKSKVPYRVIERYVGRPALLSQVHEPLASQTIRDYLQEHPLGAVENMGVENIQDDPVTYTFRLALEPYTELGEFADLKVEPRELNLTQEEKDQEKTNLLERFAEVKKVESAADWQDLVTLDVKSVILDEEKQPTDEVVLEEDDWQITLEREGTLQPPGLEEEIIGLDPGQRKSFALAYPEDSASVHAGKQVQFDLTVKAVERSQEPEWDQELLAKAMNETGELRPLAEYEEVFWNRQSHNKANRVFQEELEEAFASLEEVSVLEYAKSAVDTQVDHMIHQRMQGLEQFGIRNLETYLRYTQQTLEEFRESLEPVAETTLKQNLLIWDFIEKQGIEIPEDQQERLAQQSAVQAEQMMNSDLGKREGASQEGFQSSLLQHSMSETLRHLGRNALLELFTDGVHSLEKYSESLPSLELAEQDGEAGEEVSEAGPENALDETGTSQAAS